MVKYYWVDYNNEQTEEIARNYVDTQNHVKYYKAYCYRNGYKTSGIVILNEEEFIRYRLKQKAIDFSASALGFGGGCIIGWFILVPLLDIFVNWVKS